MRNLCPLVICIAGLTASVLASHAVPAMAFRADSPDQARSWQQQARQKLFALMMGGQPPERCPLDPKVLRRIDVTQGGYVLEELILTVHSGPHVFDGRDFFTKLRAVFTDAIQASESVTAIPGKETPANESRGATITRLTYKQAKERIPDRPLPPFWIGDITHLPDRFSRLKTAKVNILARSPGGRPIHLVTFGEPENLPSRANFNSAVGGRDLSAYRDKTSRKRPVILLVGPVHGQEVEGLTGLINLIEILETGRDLRGRDQSGLRALGRKCHLLIIPDGNPDGIARFEPRSLQGLTKADLLFWGQGTWNDDSFCGWPESKRLHPMTGSKVGFLGCYFNDQGINPMHDEFFDPMSTEAQAILRVAKEAAPDLAVSLHSHENRPAILRPAYLPLEVQEEVRKLAQLCYAVLDQQGLPDSQPFAVQPEKGAIPSSFNLTSALYHISGARSFTFECPHGLADATSCPVNLEQILDIQLALYEAMFRFELDRKQ